MRLSSELVATLLAVYIASAAPVNDVTPPSECFLLPEIIHSFDYPFTLSILNPPLNDHQSQSWLPLRLSPPIPSPRTSSNLIISSDDSKFAPTQFQLKDSKLIARSSAAVLLPTEDISPPPLVQFVFGGDFVKTPGDDVQFFAIYACDDNNEEYLQLLADSSKPASYEN